MIQRLIFLLLFSLISGCVSGRVSGPDYTGPLIQVAEPLLQCRSAEESKTTKTAEAKARVEAIVNGRAVDFFDPDQRTVVEIRVRRSNRESICTGSLISDRVVLTAAHCVAGVSPSDVLVKFVTETGCAIGRLRVLPAAVAVVDVHEDFDGTPQSLSDLGLLKLKVPAPTDVERLKIASDFENLSDDLAFLGFGITDESAKDSEVLRRVDKKRSELTLKERVIIIDQTDTKGGFCRGDSGAPILARQWGEPRIIGVNSATIGLKPNTECHTASVSMNMIFFRSWVLKISEQLEKRTWVDQVRDFFSL